MRTLKGRWLASGLLAFVASGCNLVFGLEHHELDQGSGGAGGGGGGPSCTDGVKNSDETDKDCGGAVCTACSEGKGCKVGPDCDSQVCSNGTCLAPTCNDNVKNGNETAIDCGGGTATDCPCAMGKSCKIGDDCSSGVCALEVCVDYHVWSKQIGGSQATDLVSPSALTVDDKGNVTLAATLDGTANLDGAALTSAGASDIVLAQVNPAGNYLWTRRYGDDQDDIAHGLAADSQGSVVVTGNFSGKLDFNIVNVGALVSKGFTDAFVAKIGSTGSCIWSKRFGDGTSAFAVTIGNAVTVDGSDDVIVTGNYSNSIDLGGGPFAAASGPNNVFVASFDPTGKYVWGTGFGDSSEQDGTGIAADSSGNVWVTGTTAGGIDFGTSSVANLGGVDIFLVKFDGAGKALWSSHFGSDNAGNAGSANVATDGSGNVYVAGTFEDSIDFGGEKLMSAGGHDLFVAKLDGAGNRLWSKRFGGATDEPRVSMTVSKAGEVTILGDFPSTIDFGGHILSSTGDSAVFVAKFDTAGNCVWARSFADTQSKTDNLGSLVQVGATNVVVAGQFGGAIDLGGGPLTNAGAPDIFLAKLRTP